MHQVMQMYRSMLYFSIKYTTWYIVNFVQCNLKLKIHAKISTKNHIDNIEFEHYFWTVFQFLIHGCRYKYEFSLFWVFSVFCFIFAYNTNGISIKERFNSLQLYWHYRKSTNTFSFIAYIFRIIHFTYKMPS